MSATASDQQRLQQQANPDSMEAMVRFAFDLLNMLAAIAAAPFEMILRRRIGSRYQHIVVLALAPILPLIILAASLTAGQLSHSTAPIGMGIMYAVMQVFLWLHYIHVFHVIARPEKEESSREDGKPFPFWRMLPRGDSWCMVRFIYEPGLLIASGILLWLLHIVTPVVAGYMVYGGLALVVRMAFLYYYAWEYLRDILDQFPLMKKMMGASNSQSSQDHMRAVIEQAIARRPRTVPVAVMKTVQRQAEASLPPELRDLLDKSL